MTHLRIEQNNGVIEEVSSSIITKLYEIAYAGLDASSNLQGRLHTPVAYRYEVQYLTEHFPDLFITLDNYAIPFEDPNMVTYLNSIGVGSNGAVTEAQATAATIVANSANTKVTKFNELKYFTNITQSKGGWTGGSSGYTRFYQWTALEEVDISNFTSLGHVSEAAWEDTFRDCTSLKTVTASDKLTRIGVRAFYNCTNLEHIIGLSGTIQVSNQAFYNCSKLPDEDIADVEFEPAYEGTTLRGGNAFESTNFTEITLSSNTTKIPAKMFWNCSNLKTVNGLGSNITGYNNQCFQNCTKFTGPIDFTNVTHIGGSAFMNSGLTGVVDLQNISSIDQGTNFTNTKITSVNYHGNNLDYSGSFTGCTNLVTISGANNILSIPNGICNGCISLTSVDFNWNNVTNHMVPTEAFRNCSSLQSIDLTGATTIYNYAFHGCTSLTQINGSQDVVTIGRQAFQECTNITQLNLPNCQIAGTNSNNIAIFRDCTSLQKVVLGDCVKLGNKQSGLDAGRPLFGGCTSLHTVDVKSLQYTVSQANAIFRNCPNMQTFIIRSTTPPTMSNEDSTIDMTGFGGTGVTIYVPDSAVNDYKTALAEIASYIQSLKEYTGSMNFYNETFTTGKYQGYKFGSLNIVDSSGSGSLPQNAFNSCVNLTNVTLEGISSIGVNAFGSCTSLESINLDGVTINGDGAFIGCTSLTTIGNNSMLSLFPNGKVRTWSFGQCSSLQGPFDFTGITEIGGSSFDRSGLSGILNLPDVVTIGSSNAFGSTNITKAIIGDSITFIGGSCFGGCTNLTEVDIDFSNIPVANQGNMGSFVSGCTSLQTFDCTGLETLAHDFFNNCSSLTTLNGLDDVTTISAVVFKNCSSLSSIDLDWTKLTSIGYEAFYGCNSLPIPTLNCTSLTSLGHSTFRGCTGLQTITSLGTITSISNDTFRSCSNLTSVDLSNMTSIGTRGFAYCSKLTSVDLSGITDLGQEAFSGCTLLSSLNRTTFSGITRLHAAVFKDCPALTGELSFPDITELIYENNFRGVQFQGCTNLTKITLGHLINLNHGYAASSDAPFKNCTNLKIVDLGDSLTTISCFNFQGCSNLKAIKLNITTPPSRSTTAANSTDLHLFFGNSNVNIYVPDAAVSTYQATSPYSNFADHIKPLSTYNEASILAS